MISTLITEEDDIKLMAKPLRHLGLGEPVVKAKGMKISDDTDEHNSAALFTDPKLQLRKVDNSHVPSKSVIRKRIVKGAFQKRNRINLLDQL